MLLLVSLIAACGNPRRDQALSAPPMHRQTAVLQLAEQMRLYGEHMRDARVEDATVFWRSDFNRTLETRWSDHVLSYSEIKSIAPPEKTAYGWTLSIDATGGKTLFHFSSRDASLRAKAALEKLRDP